MGCEKAILRRFFIRLNQLNSARHGKGKILSDESEISSRLKVKYSYGSIELKNGRISTFLALNAFAKEVEIDLRCIRQIFLERLNTSLRDG